MKRLSGIITILTIAISGYIGYTTNYVETTKANPSPPVYRLYTDVPKPLGFALDIDLNKGRVVANAQPHDIRVDITKKDSIVYKYITKTVDKIKYVKVFEQPPVRQRKSVVRLPLPKQPNRVSVSDNTQQDS